MARDSRYDILFEVGQQRLVENRARPLLVGFAAETGEVTAEATRKVHAKGAHLICANDVSEAGSGFGTDTNRVTLFGRDGSVEALPMLPKPEVATRIVARAAELVRAREA